MFDYLSKAGITQLLTAIKGKFAAASHTHNYAGSSSSGGSATSAVKLTTSAGSATEPVYFSDGKPVKCSRALIDEAALSGYLPLTGGMTTGTTGLAGNFRVYVGEFTRIQFLLNGQWVTVISGDNANNGIIVGNLGLEKAAFNVDDPSHAYVNSYPIYSAGYKPFATGSFGKSSGAVTIDCGFKPSYVVIFCDTPSTYIYSTGVSIVFTLNNTGFVVSADIPSGKYSYIAFR